MDKYVIKRKTIGDSSVENNDDNVKQGRMDVNLEDLPTNPGLHIRILDYNPNIRDDLRRAYLLKWSCQPRNHEFPHTLFREKSRRFNPAWFDEFPTWLEYSVHQNATYCLCCCLFKPNVEAQAGGDPFVGLGFENWSRKDKLQIHIGGVNSAHNQAWAMCKALINKRQQIESVIIKHSAQTKIDYKIRLNASFDCVWFLLRQGLAFKGHNESESSNNIGNFLEPLHFLADHNESVKAITFKNAPENLKLTSPDIQKSIAKVAAIGTTKRIVSDFCGDLFSVLIDESRDVSTKEQMSVVHVLDTTSITLKTTPDGLFSKHGLSISNLRGQGYDGASNMKGEIGGLKTLILNEKRSAYYVHCFAHQLQLTLVVVAKNHLKVTRLFMIVNNVVNVAGGSCKCHDHVRDLQFSQVMEGLNLGEILSGRWLNQETSLVRVGDTRWGSHYGTLVNMIRLFPTVIKVLEMIEEYILSQDKKKCEASELFNSLQTFDFVFCLHFMKTILGITKELSQALQRKEQDIVNAMNFVAICKKQLQNLRDNGCDSLLIQVIVFCEKHNIDVCDMDEVLYFLDGHVEKPYR